MLMIRSVHGSSKAILLGLIAATSGEVAAQSLQLEEIVVTARRREESIQDIPVAVTAFSAEELTRRGVTELEDVAMYTPGFVFEDFASSFSAAPVLRGLTQVNVSSEVQNVATFVDGVYIQRNYAVDISGADVQRIEIVKGPQSALYGQNAFAGAINYVLNRPDDELNALAEVTGGSDGRLDYRVAAGGPLIDDKLGLRGAYSKAEFDGTWRNSLPGLDGDSARTGQSESETYSLKAVFTPTEWLEVDATYLRVDRSVGIRPGYNINTGDVQNTGNCGPLNATTRNPIFICGELPVSPDRFYTSRSTRAPGLDVLYLPTAGFRNETEFLGADAIVRFGRFWRWMAFIDIDEFLYSGRSSSVRWTILRSPPERASISTRPARAPGHARASPCSARACATFRPASTTPRERSSFRSCPCSARTTRSPPASRGGSTA